MILLGYDGSTDARTAIDHAGELLNGQPMTILTVWEPFVDALTRSGAFGWVAPVGNVAEIDQASQRSAQQHAEEGVEHARRVGLEAQPRVVARDGTIAETILGEARALDAAAIVLGTRGLGGLKSVFLGSVSHAVLQHAERTVVVVPSPAVVARRVA